VARRGERALVQECCVKGDTTLLARLGAGVFSIRNTELYAVDADRRWISQGAPASTIQQNGEATGGAVWRHSPRATARRMSRVSTLNPNPSSDFFSKLSQARHQRGDGDQFRRVRGVPLYTDPYCGTGAHVVLEMEDCAGYDCDDVFNGGGFGERHCPCIASCIVEVRCRPCGKCTWSVVVPQYPQSSCGPRQYTGQHRLAAIPVIEKSYLRDTVTT
jgi:hypothetical protein